MEARPNRPGPSRPHSTSGLPQLVFVKPIRKIFVGLKTGCIVFVKIYAMIGNTK